YARYLVQFKSILFIFLAILSIIFYLLLITLLCPINLDDVRKFVLMLPFVAMHQFLHGSLLTARLVLSFLYILQDECSEDVPTNLLKRNLQQPMIDCQVHRAII